MVDEPVFDQCARLLEAVAEKAAPSVLQPRTLHIGYFGLIAMTFDDFFPQPIENLKSMIESGGLPFRTESDGSYFPKVNLGALVDDAVAFTLEELQSLRTICETFSERLRTTECIVPVDTLSLVEFKCRCLEVVKEQRDFILSDKDVDESDSSRAAFLQAAKYMITLDQTGDEQHGIDASPMGNVLTITKVQKGLATDWNALNPPRGIRVGSAIVDVNGKHAIDEMLDALKDKVVLRIGVKQECLSKALAGWNQDLEAFFPLLGNTSKRIGNYREEFIGTTLVAFVRNQKLANELAEFQAAVNEALPGRYKWFRLDSLHVTIRGMDFDGHGP